MPSDQPDFAKAFPEGVLLVTALSDRSMRVRFVRAGTRPEMPKSEILLDGLDRPCVKVETKDGLTRLNLPHLRCEVNAATGRLRFFGRDGHELLTESEAGRRLVPGRLGDEAILIAEQAFESPSDERIYGTGCFQDGVLNIRALPRRLTQVNTQISLPFILSSKGYGLIWHHRGRSEFNTPPHQMLLAKRATGQMQKTSVSTSSGGAEVERRLAIFEGEFAIANGGRHALLLDIGQKMGTRYRIEIDGQVYADYANFWLPPTTSFIADLSPGLHRVKLEANDMDAPVLFYGPAADRTVWRSPVADAIDYVVVAGPSPAEIMGGYRDLLGATPMPPLWAFGYVHSRERFHSSEEIIDTLDEFRRRKLPVDVMVQDWMYWGKHGWNAMRFDEEHYPDPAALIEDVHRRDARFMLSVWSRIDPDSELGQEFTRRNFYIPGTTWVDFFNSDAVAFYCANQEEKLASLGIDAWWQDANEPENDDLDGRTTAIGRGEHVQLAFPLEVTRAVHQSRRATDPDKRVMILTRSAFLGQHRYGAFTWSGDIGHDFDTLKNQIPAGLNMAAAGYSYWSVDAGGFFRPGPGQYTDPGYRECFLRWFQYATFLPMQRVHGFESDTEFWRYGDEVETVARSYLELRYRLLPYIYSTAAETARTGVPMMRPLVFDFPEDQRALDQSHAYMFGNAFHVAPVFEAGVRNWPVYLPQSEGGWFDFWTGEHRQGGRVHDVASPIDRVPLHVRAGSIVPLGPVLQSTTGTTNAELDLHVFPGRDATFDLYEDDGLSNAYERGGSARIPLKWDQARGEFRIEACKGSYAGMPEARRLTVHGVGPGRSPVRPGQGLSVEITGKPVCPDFG